MKTAGSNTHLTIPASTEQLIKFTEPKQEEGTQRGTSLFLKNNKHLFCKSILLYIHISLNHFSEVNNKD